VRHIFVPAERKISKVRIETRQADTLSSQRIIVAIDSWPRNSRYPLVSTLHWKTSLSYVTRDVFVLCEMTHGLIDCVYCSEEILHLKGW